MSRPTGYMSTPTGSTADSRRVWLSRSEEHTSELQSRLHLVCRLLLEKKKKHHVLDRPQEAPHSTIHCNAGDRESRRHPAGLRQCTRDGAPAGDATSRPARPVLTNSYE